jgi:diguanylate cyclase (GGDEF)-like protein/PAS domain S-box-containing protein
MTDTNDDFYKGVLDNLYDGVYSTDRDRKIIYWNKGAERLTGYAAEQVTGSRCSDNILNHVDSNGTILCTNACPLAMTIMDGAMREADVFLHHADGHRVPVSIRISPTRDSSGAITGAVEIFSDASFRIAALDRISELQRESLIDPLTGTGNRRYTEINIRSSMTGLQQQQMNFGIILIDIDFFKNVNDTCGHSGGDLVLKMVANTLAKNINSYDFIGRWGGEEFVLVIHNIDAKNLLAMAEKLRLLVKHSHVKIGGRELSVTVSMGATLARPGDSEASLFDRADRLMYSSKADGRNRVSMDL